MKLHCSNAFTEAFSLLNCKLYISSENKLFFSRHNHTKVHQNSRKYHSFDKVTSKITRPNWSASNNKQHIYDTIRISCHIYITTNTNICNRISFRPRTGQNDTHAPNTPILQIYSLLNFTEQDELSTS